MIITPPDESSSTVRFYNRPGKIDLIIKHAGKTHGVELKTCTDRPGYKEVLKKAAEYGRQLRLEEISPVFFVEYIDDSVGKVRFLTKLNFSHEQFQ